MSTLEKFTVEIWSDVVCPWCAVGKVRFERALAEFPHADEVEVRWRSFELDPDAPQHREGDYVSMLGTKYGASREQAQDMIDRMVENGTGEGLDFRFDIIKPGNTFDAHRLLHLAADRGLQHQLKDRFLLGYHGQGEAVGDHDTLARLAVEAGLDEVDIKGVLTTDAYADAVRADEEQAREYGIGGVPFFVLDGRFGINGAQPAEAILPALTRAWDTRGDISTEAPTHEHAGDACGVDGCAI